MVSDSFGKSYLDRTLICIRMSTYYFTSVHCQSAGVIANIAVTIHGSK